MTQASTTIRYNPAGWLRFVDRAEQTAELHSLIVERQGETVIAATADPWRATDPQLMYSLSKTFCSAAVGIAIEKGGFDYDTPIVDLFPDQVDERVGPKARTITVGNLLSMSSGHEEETLDLVASRGGLDRDAIGAFLRLEPEGTPGITFAYNQPCTWTCSRAVQEVLGMSVLELLNQDVFPALGITEAVWQRDLDGVPIGFSGLHLTPSSIASFFALLRAGGVKDGVQLLPTEWIDRFSTAKVATGETDPENDWTFGYGYQVWIQRLGFRGDGYAGQYGIILPEQQMSIEITSSTVDMQSVLDALWAEVIPDLDAEPDPAAAQALTDRLTGWTVPPLPAAPAIAWSGLLDAYPAELVLDPPRLHWTDASASHELELGQGVWVDGELKAGNSRLSVACCLGVQDGNQVVRIAARNTPHTLTLVLGKSQLEAEQTWNTEPLGAVRLIELVQEFDG